MKISSSAIGMQSTHVAFQAHSLTESTEFWVGRRNNNPGRASRMEPQLEQRPRRDEVQLSDAGKTAAADESKDDQTTRDPLLGMIRTMIEYLTGRRMKLFDPSELQQKSSGQGEAAGEAAAAGYGYEYHRHEVYTESETTSFSASGLVKTEDGQEIRFDLSLSMSRTYVEESDTLIQLGDAGKATDPLVLNFAGTAAQLANTRFQFDLDMDGKTEKISQLGGGSGFLAFDRNHDGKINNGSELFGPASGNGFQELAALDEDGNGWIDENDSAFSQLSVWQPDAQGRGVLQGLLDAGVGALALQHQRTPFAVKDADNNLLGQVQASGVFLNENGSVGSLQQIDLAA